MDVRGTVPGAEIFGLDLILLKLFWDLKKSIQMSLIILVNKEEF